MAFVFLLKLEVKLLGVEFVLLGSCLLRNKELKGRDTTAKQRGGSVEYAGQSQGRQTPSSVRWEAYILPSA